MQLHPSPIRSFTHTLSLTHHTQQKQHSQFIHRCHLQICLTRHLPRIPRPSAASSPLRTHVARSIDESINESMDAAHFVAAQTSHSFDCPCCHLPFAALMLRKSPSNINRVISPPNGSAMRWPHFKSVHDSELMRCEIALQEHMSTVPGASQKKARAVLL